MEPDKKYAENKTWAGNCPFLRHNREKYIEVKKEKADALRKEEETKGKIN